MDPLVHASLFALQTAILAVTLYAAHRARRSARLARASERSSWRLRARTQATARAIEAMLPPDTLPAPATPSAPAIAATEALPAPVAPVTAPAEAVSTIVEELVQAISEESDEDAGDQECEGSASHPTHPPKLRLYVPPVADGADADDDSAPSGGAGRDGATSSSLRNWVWPRLS
jgi:hypothetical protein